MPSERANQAENQDCSLEKTIRACRSTALNGYPWHNHDIDCLLRQLDRARAERNAAIARADQVELEFDRETAAAYKDGQQDGYKAARTDAL